MMTDYKVETINDSMQLFFVIFHGPKESAYQGGVWKIRVELPEGYPYKSPSIDLVNVFEVFLPQLLLYPNPTDPLNSDAAALMIRDRTAYDQIVKEYCEKYAKPEDAGVAPEQKSSDDEVTEDEDTSSDEDVAGKSDP
ncbi:hypothetical protein DH2020_049202 [Rehmannia glutinosa]|uniref:UBC core domain-containing protein n=1 Tax=Rehmannia glutinosa TaxID=99300 RepID=A0ABR0U3Z9_REHGL